MPEVRIVQRFGFPRAALFAFFLRPENHVAVAPAGVHIKLVSGPAVMAAGQRTTVLVKRWGLSQRIETEVVELLAPQRIVEEQRQGPFARWRHVREFAEAGENETEVTETVVYEPPGGMLGLVMTAARIETELRAAYLGREERVAALLA